MFLYRFLSVSFSETSLFAAGPFGLIKLGLTGPPLISSLLLVEP